MDHDLTCAAAALRRLPPSCGPVRLVAVDGHAVPDMPALAAVLTEVTGWTTLTVGRDDARVDVTVDALPSQR